MPEIGRTEGTSSSTKPFSLFGFYDQPYPVELRDLLYGETRQRLGAGQLTPFGFSDALREGLLGKEYGQIAQAQRGASDRLAGSLAQRGLTGSGVDVGANIELENLFGQQRAGAAQDVFIAEEGQKRQDIQGFLKVLETLLGPAGTESKTKGGGGWSIGF